MPDRESVEGFFFGDTSMQERGVAVFPSWGVAVSPGCIRLLRVAGALTIQGTSVSGSGGSTGKPVN